jgi:hypothetical protein
LQSGINLASSLPATWRRHFRNGEALELTMPGLDAEVGRTPIEGRPSSVQEKPDAA